MGNYDKKVGVWTERFCLVINFVYIIIGTIWQCIIAVLEGIGKVSLILLILAITTLVVLLSMNLVDIKIIQMLSMV